ncbi:MAG TPA: hypothetical protein VHO01_14315 [Jatrophihabitans sp.]|nr:hypothetical protein [Jatrophihabitans sp.]
MRRWLRRLCQLYLGLALYGTSMALMVRARLGLDPWDVLQQGIALKVHHSIGTVSIAVGALVLLLWIPLRQRPGLGTVSNVLVIGLVMNVVLEMVPGQHGLSRQLPMLVGAILLCGLATGMYISARLGPGPRDGLMTGLATRTGWSIRLTRTVIELVVLGSGWVLGGSVGIGTLAFAFGIGPAAQFFLKLLAIPTAEGEPSLVPDPVAAA